MLVWELVCNKNKSFNNIREICAVGIFPIKLVFCDWCYLNNLSLLFHFTKVIFNVKTKMRRNEKAIME